MNKISDFLVRGKWNCIKCGACCSFITPLVESKKLPEEFLGRNGRCVNLKEDNLCAIYETRPDICRIDKTLQGVSDKEIAKMCRHMKDFKGLMDGRIKNIS